MPRSTEVGLGQAVEELRQGIFTADKAKLAALTAPELSYGHSTGLMQSQAEFIAGMAGRPETMKWLDFSEVKTFASGDVGVVRHRWTGEVEQNGKITRVDIGVLLVWQKRGGEWKLLARQAFKIP